MLLIAQSLFRCIQVSNKQIFCDIILPKMYFKVGVFAVEKECKQIILIKLDENT